MRRGCVGLEHVRASGRCSRCRGEGLRVVDDDLLAGESQHALAFERLQVAVDQLAYGSEPPSEFRLAAREREFRVARLFEQIDEYASEPLIDTGGGNEAYECGGAPQMRP